MSGRNQYAEGKRPIHTTAAEREALVDWFDRLPANDPTRANRAVSWLVFKIRRAQRSYELGVVQEPIAGDE